MILGISFNLISGLDFCIVVDYSVLIYEEHTLGDNGGQRSQREGWKTIHKFFFH